MDPVTLAIDSQIENMFFREFSNALLGAGTFCRELRKALEDEETRTNPAKYAVDVLGVKNLWGKQREFLEGIYSNEKTAIRGGHATGKTFGVACVAIHFLLTHQGSVVPVSSATGRQAKRQVFAEMKKLWRRAHIPHPGEVLDTIIRPDPDNDSWSAFSFATKDANLFTGFHAPAGVLIVMDEAAGIKEDIWAGALGCLAGEGSYLVALGNPTCSAGTFHEAFHSQRTEWKTYTLSCLDHPNVVRRMAVIPGAVTKKWVDERRRQFGEDHPFWRMRVLGLSPEGGINSIVPADWIELAMNRTPDKCLDHEIRMGIDVARFGKDSTQYVIRRGAVIVHRTGHAKKSTTETVGRAIQLAKQFKVLPGNIMVDDTGVGGGVTDMLNEHFGCKGNITAVNFGERAAEPTKFANKKAEIYWHLREMLDPERAGPRLALSPRDDVLARDLDQRYFITSKGQIAIEAKEVVIARTNRSPDEGDALALTFVARTAAVRPRITVV